jgi:hypothetical protein
MASQARDQDGIAARRVLYALDAAAAAAAAAGAGVGATRASASASASAKRSAPGDDIYGAV